MVFMGCSGQGSSATELRPFYTPTAGAKPRRGGAGSRGSLSRGWSGRNALRSDPGGSEVGCARPFEAHAAETGPAGPPAATYNSPDPNLKDRKRSSHGAWSHTKSILIGNLGADPETRSMLRHDRWRTSASPPARAGKTSSRGAERRTEWHHVALFGRLGEVAGSTCARAPRCTSRDRSHPQVAGQGGRDRYTTEVIAATCR